MILSVVVLLAASCSLSLAVPPVWSPNGCGISKYADAGEMDLPAKIVGGMEPREYEFPWQVSIRHKVDETSHFCGGSVINENWVLCAAHCMVNEETAGLLILAGEYQRSAPSTVRQYLEVDSIYVHENYNPSTMQNDVSVIKLKTPVKFNENVAAVCAPDPDDQYTYRKSQCSGWGTIRSGGTCCPDVLRYVTMNITTNELCDGVYALANITADMICASDNTGMTERDSCQGDSGGPLTVKDADGTFRIVGIVSWGNGCASGYPGVYSRVGFLADWITNTITNN
jgi:secreted trypsin-like serine protease